MTTQRFFITLIFVLTITLLLPSFISAKMVSVKGNDVNLRSGPGKNYSVKWKYGNGFPLRVIGQKGKWYKVEDFESDIGWLHSSVATSKGHLIVKVNKNKNQKINVRSGPGTKYKIVGKAYYGVVFETLKQQSGWAKVKHESGLEGWVKRTLLWGF